jgi:putative colanic acid biosynthesis acetyltransferase WcaF
MSNFPTKNFTDLSGYTNNWYKPGAGRLKRVLWFIINAWLFASYNPFNGLKIFLLRAFGAKVGKNVVIKPAVNIKYPWRLVIGDYAWIGEKVWIDNLEDVQIGKNVCISQAAILLCGNHNYRSSGFDLMVGKIILEDGCWIGARAIVCPGVTCGSHAVLTVNSVAVGNLEPYSINTGNPAVKMKARTII